MKTFAQTRWNLLAAVTFLAFAPTRLDAGGNSQQSVDQRVDQLTRLISAIHAALDGVVFVLGHAVVVAAHIVVVACVATAVVWLLVKTAVPLTHRRMGQSRLASVRIVPPIEGAYNTASWVTFFQMLHAIAAPWWKRALFGQAWLVFELEAHEGHIIARCWFPTGTEKLVAAAIRSALPGANIMPTEDGLAPPRPQAARARLRLWREDLYPLEASQTDAIATAAEALAGAGDGLIQVAMAPDTGWEARAGKRLDQLSGFDSHESIFLKVLRLPLDFLFEFWFSYPEPASKPPSQRRAAAPLPPTDKAGQACWRVEVRLCCWAPRRSSAIGSLRPIVSAFQALDGENRLRVAKVWWPLGFDSALTKRLGPGHTSMVLSPAEAAQLFHLPLAGVPMDSARVRAMPRRLSLVAGDGSVLCRLDDDRRAAVKISQTDRRHHLHAVGPTGAGKSTLLLNLALQDIEAGIGVGVIDPKGDLIRDLLERIPTQHANRVILLDPSTRERPVGLNVLECDDPSQRELVTDGVVTIFRKNFERFWGPRTDDVLRAALLTLLRHPGATLTEVPLLLLNQRVRARLTKNLGDPVGLKPFWQEYEAQTEGQRLQMVGPVLNKLRTFLMRPTVRNVLGQSRSTIDLREVIDGGGILLVNLAKGALGEETSRLVGSFVMSRLWQAALARASRPEAWRPDFNLYLDEFHNYLHLPQSIDDVLAEARSYRLNLTLANQHLAQLHESTRQAVASNARTRIVFQCGPDDSRHVARDFEPLTVHQLQSLDRFQIAVRLSVDGNTQPPFTGTTLAAPASLGEEHAAAAAAASLDRYGRPVTEVEAEIIGRLGRFGAAGGFKEIA
jgi:hypothetical protein